MNENSFSLSLNRSLNRGLGYFEIPHPISGRKKFTVQQREVNYVVIMRVNGRHSDVTLGVRADLLTPQKPLSSCLRSMERKWSESVASIKSE